MKKHGIKVRTLKIGIVAIAILLATTLVSATLIQHFGKVETTMTVTQSVMIDNQPYNTLIKHDIPNAEAGCCYCFEHEVTNNGCEAIALEFTEWGSPNLDGIEVMYKERCYLSQLNVDVLDGIADDSFKVYVDGTLVHTYSWSGNTAETWITHAIDLKPFNMLCFGTHTVRIDSTGPAWGSHATYGQVAVDGISLYCGTLLCDSVDIGNPTSETGHNLVSWGPIEPANTGGNYGGITDCRVVYEPAGSTFATVDLTCEFCECDCEKPELEMPFTLEPDETLEFCICYKLSMLLMPGTYTVQHKLIPQP